MTETYSFNEALERSLEWCKRNEGWERYCDIEDTDSLYLMWDDLPEETRNRWKEEYSEESAESMWEEFAYKIAKFPFGFISGKGEFYEDILRIPINHNFMTVFKMNSFSLKNSI